MFGEFWPTVSYSLGPILHARLDPKFGSVLRQQSQKTFSKSTKPRLVDKFSRFVPVVQSGRVVMRTVILVRLVN